MGLAITKQAKYFLLVDQQLAENRFLLLIFTKRKIEDQNKFVTLYLICKFVGFQDFLIYLFIW